MNATRMAALMLVLLVCLLSTLALCAGSSDEKTGGDSATRPAATKAATTNPSGARSTATKPAATEPGAAQAGTPTPQALARAIVASIKSRNVEAAVNCAVSPSDVEWAQTNLPASISANDRERALAAITKTRPKTAQRRLGALAEDTTNKTIHWSEIRIEDIRLQGPTTVGIEWADVYIKLHDGSDTWYMKLNDCGKVQRGWVMFGFARLSRDPSGPFRE